jgi:ribonuclease BN (tRNA processing enzyme)
MHYEIDFLPVGDSNGDAICLRYGAENGFWVHVVDGGFIDTADTVINHIRFHYGAGIYIDHMVFSHADNDHACGVVGVIKAMRVENLWMNRPWLYAPDIIGSFHGTGRSMAAHQYINAANVITNAIKQDEIEDFRLAHPALFLYRHAVELVLKAVVPNARKVHRLDKLADRFKEFVKAEFGEDVPRWLKDRLRELAQIDPNSTAFRYAHEGISGDELHVDLAHLQRTMAILQDVFDRVYEVASSRQSCGPLLRRRHDQKQL